MGSYVGASAVLECLVEGFPRPAVVWERYDGLVLREAWEDKFLPRERPVPPYGVRATLNVTVTSSNEFGAYFCRAENRHGGAKGGVNIVGK